MPGLRASIVYGWRELSTLFRGRFHPESRLWNRKVLPWRLGEALYEALPKSRQCPRTSRRDRFALAMRRLHFARDLRSACDLRCRSPSRTTGRCLPLHRVQGCSEKGTSETGHLYPPAAFPSRTVLPSKGLRFVRFELSLDHLDQHLG